MESFQLYQDKWGVCGFIAAIQAAHYNEITPYSKNFSATKRTESKTESVLSETRSSVIYLVGELSKKLTPSQQADVLNFTLTAKDLTVRPKTYDDIVTHLLHDKTLKKRIDFTISADVMMTLCELVKLKFKTVGKNNKPELLSDFLKYKGSANTIVGIGKDYKGDRNGLAHWVYINPHGELITWGLRGVSAASALQRSGLHYVNYHFKF